LIDQSVSLTLTAVKVRCQRIGRSHVSFRKKGF
jgi:hypothetical protein